MMACSSNNQMTKDVALPNIPMAKLFHWRMALFYAVLPIGEVESMIFYFHPTYIPDEKIRKLITNKGGCVIDSPNDDPFTIILVNTKAKNFNADTQIKERYDLFDCSFIENCAENKKLVDLNSYRIGESIYEEYDANEILNRRLKWETIEKKQIDFHTAGSSAFAKIVKDPNNVSVTESAEENVLSNTPNKNAEASSIPNLPSTSSNVLSLHKNNVPKTVVQSPDKLMNELSRPSEPLAAEINPINSTPSKSSSKPGTSSQKKRQRVRITNYSSDTSSTSSSMDKPPPPKQRKSYPRQRLSHLSLAPSADGRRYKSLPNNGQSPLNITKVFENLTALSRTDLYGRSKEKDVPLTRNKSKNKSTSAHKSSIGVVEKNVAESQNTKSQTESSSSEEKAPSTSKKSMALSKPAPSTTNSTISIVEKNVVSPSKSVKSQSISPASLKEIAASSNTSVVLSRLPSSTIKRTVPTLEKIVTRSTHAESQSETFSLGEETSPTFERSRALSEFATSATNRTSQPVEKIVTRSLRTKTQAETVSSVGETSSTSKASRTLSERTSSATKGKISPVEKIATRSQFAKYQAETSSSKKAIPSTSKSSVALSKPAYSATYTKPKDGETFNSFKSPQKLRTSPNASTSTISTFSRFRPAACSSPIVPSSGHLWASALRDDDESNSIQPEKQKQARGRPRKQFLDEAEDERSWRCVSPVESLTEEDFHGVTGDSTASTIRKKPYTQHDKHIMLKYICEGNLHQFTRGNRIWRTLADEKLIPGRTYQSLREHFLKQILPHVMENRRVSIKDKQKFERAAKIVKLGKRAAGPSKE